MFVFVRSHWCFTMLYYRVDSWTYYWIKLMLKAWNEASNYYSTFWKTYSRWNLSAYSKNKPDRSFPWPILQVHFCQFSFFKEGRNWSDFFSPWNVFLKLTCYINTRRYYEHDDMNSVHIKQFQISKAFRLSQVFL